MDENTSNNFIEFRNIKKSYGDNLVIPNLNLSIEKGDFLTVIGSSGCGKTTMLKMINRLITPDSGDIFIDGKNIADFDVVNLRRKIGYSIQGTMLFPHLTVKENISYVPDLIAEDEKKEIKRRYRENSSRKIKIRKNQEQRDEERATSDNKDSKINKWLDIVGLDSDLLERFPNELSGG